MNGSRFTMKGTDNLSEKTKNGNGKISIKYLYYGIALVVLVISLFITVGARIDNAVANHPIIVELKTNQRIVIENQKEMKLQLEEMRKQLQRIQLSITKLGEP